MRLPSDAANAPSPAALALLKAPVTEYATVTADAAARRRRKKIASGCDQSARRAPAPAR